MGIILVQFSFCSLAVGLIMKNIEIDEDLYQYIVSNTQAIGESASSILRRLLKIDGVVHQAVSLSESAKNAPVEQLLQEERVDEEIIINDAGVIKERDHNAESVFDFINKEELAMQRGAVGRFLLILAALYRAHSKQFNVVINIAPKESARKIKRLYFALSEAELSASGSSTKPKPIPDSPFWVITNSNTTRKKMMLTKAAISLGYGEAEVEKIRDLL